MIDPRELDRLTAAIRNAEAHLAKATAAIQAMADARNGWPTSTDGPGSKGLASSPVEAAAGQRDIGGNALRHHQADIRRATLALEQVVKAWEAWAPHPASTTERRITEPDPGRICDLCSAPAVYSTDPVVTGTGGRRDLCPTCYQRRRRQQHSTGTATRTAGR